MCAIARKTPYPLACMAARHTATENLTEASTPDVTFGVVLRIFRLEKGLTQEQLAWKTGTERAFISELERGIKGASINILFRLADGLQTSPAAIILEVEKKLRHKSSEPAP